MRIKLNIDRLIRVWRRDSVSIEADSVEEALKIAKKEISNGAIDTGYDKCELYDSYNIIESESPVKDNDGNEFIEIFESGKKIWTSEHSEERLGKNFTDKLFKHNKTGNYYYVICEAMHTETKEDYVAYVALYGDNKMYVRPKSMFYEDVVINGKKMKRFEPAGDDKDAVKALYDYYDRL